MATQVLHPPTTEPPNHTSDITDPHSRPASTVHNNKGSPANPTDSGDSIPRVSVNVNDAQHNNKPNGNNEKVPQAANPNPAPPITAMNISMPIRPPPKPFKRANLSLEQNPFEYSFSQSSSNSVPNASALANNKKPTSPKVNDDEAAGQKNGNGNGNGNGASNNEANGAPREGGANRGSPKPILPPLSSLAEPATEAANSFPWGFAAAMNDPGSLRSGPLSPAMLPGPRQDGHAAGAPNPTHTNGVNVGASHHQPFFDGPGLSFRTGLTPGIGRTGLTPLVGGPASFPPPSPNTAAFLAMVTNGGAGGGAGAAAQAVNSLTGGVTITPNTLSALTGQLIQQQVNPSDPHHVGGGQHPQHRLSVPSYPPASHPYNHNPGGADVMNGAGSYGGATNGMDNYQGAAQHATATAANGLFLLSQAHQELTKREEQQQAEAAAAAASASAVNTRSAAARRMSANTSANANASNSTGPTATTSTGGHAKRKSTEAASKAPGSAKRARGSTTGSVPTANANAAPTTRTSGRRKAATQPQPTYGESPPDMDEDASMDEDEDMMGGAGGLGNVGPGKKYETEEDKRKNFLERNRQAALKCRQRKKAWLTELQKRVEYLSSENERLQGTIVSMRDEVTRLSAVVVAHRACGLGGVVVPGYGNGSAPADHPTTQHPHPHPHQHHGGGRRGSPGEGQSDLDVAMMSPSSPVQTRLQAEGGAAGAGGKSPVSVAPVSVPVSVPPQGASPGGGGYGY